MSLIEVVVSLAIISLLFGGILLAYFSIINIVKNSEARSEAVIILNREEEVVKNLSYENIGVQGGYPTGVLLAEKTATSTKNIFVIKTTVRNIDDPYDGTIGGVPNDTAPADYKLLEISINCTNCPYFVPLATTSTIAPKNLESASADGSLFINVFNAAGVGISGATINISNSSTIPTLNFTDTTNQSGVLQLIGVPTSTQSYHVKVSKEGFSSDQTYKINDPLNPNPIKPDATVIPQTVTQLSFVIDLVGSLIFSTTNNLCDAIGNQPLTISGTKLIGTDPDVLKFSTTTTTDAGGIKILNNIEWDTYQFNYTGAKDLAGTTILSPLQFNPGTVATIGLTLASSTPKALLVTARNAITNAGIQDAIVTINKTGFSKNQITGRSIFTQDDWSGSNYTSQSGNLDTTSSSLKLQSGPDGYPTSTPEWLISKTFDLKSSSSTFHTIEWQPTTQPSQTSLQFQIATNNDQSTWNFIGSDGTANSFYDQSNSTINILNNNKQYLRYKVFLKTENSSQTPSLDDVSVKFTGICVPLYQTLFNNLDAGIYAVDVSAIGYQSASSTIDVNSSWQQLDILLNP